MGKIIFNNSFSGAPIEFNEFKIFTDTSGSPGSPTPINDLDGNIMADLDKDIAYYGTVPASELYTSAGLRTALNFTTGNANPDFEWHKYYWNGGIHFWRRTVSNTLTFNSMLNAGVVYGTGTNTSRKGNSITSTVQNKEVTKNGVTYVVRLMEGAQSDPANASGSVLHNSEYSLILLNLHAATNSGSYSNSPTDSVSYQNWTDTSNFTNNDFVGWKTNLGDINFQTTLGGRLKYMQESISSDQLTRGLDRMSFANSSTRVFAFNEQGFAPVLTVKHPSFVTYGKSGGFNQNEPDW